MTLHIRTDSLLLALDKESVRSVDQDGRLRIAVTNVCKACVSPYMGKEIPDWENLGLQADTIYQLFRPPEELEKAAPTINGVQILRKHIPVSAEDHQPWEVVGSVGTEARWEYPFIKNALTILSKSDISLLDSGAKEALSPGYHYRAVMEPGTFEGQPFSGKMVDIKFNHLAIVEEPRQGKDLVVGDTADDVHWAIIEHALTSFAS